MVVFSAAPTMCLCQWLEKKRQQCNTKNAELESDVRSCSAAWITAQGSASLLQVVNLEMKLLFLCCRMQVI